MIKKEERNRIIYPIEMERKARTVLAEGESQMNQIVSHWTAKITVILISSLNY